MRSNRTQKARMSALIIGTAAALTACTPRGDDTNMVGESGVTVGAPGAAATTGMADSAVMGGVDVAGGTISESTIMGTVSTSNAAEIVTSELAQERASNSEVKSFASDMVSAHQTMQKEADMLTKRVNIVPQPAAEADQMQQVVAATVDTLKTLNGAQFDQKYMAFQVQSHQTTLDNLRRFETATTNAEIKGLITKAIPAVQDHLERAQKIQSSLGGAAATKS